MTDFIGRGEKRVVQILEKLFPRHDIYSQVHISSLISSEAFAGLGAEHNKHKHDIVMEDWQTKKTVIEVNYNHGTIADKKWKVYKSLLQEAGHKTCTIDDSECPSLFTLENEKDINSHVNTWGDWIDVINALHKHGIKE